MLTFCTYLADMVIRLVAMRFCLKLILGGSLLILCFHAQAQKRATVTGSWSDPNIWNPVGVPTSGDNVIINSGVLVTVDIALAQSNSITLDPALAANGITVSGTNNLTTGAITINAPTVTTVTSELAVGAGTLSTTSISIIGSATANRNSRLSVSTGFINCSSNITFSGTAAQAQLSFSSTGTLNLGGNITGPGTFNAATGTVNCNGTGVQSLGPFTFHHLNLIGTTNTSTTGAITVGGNLNIGAGTTFTVATTTAKVFTGLVTIAAGGTWNETAVSAMSFANGITNNGTFTASTGVHSFITNSQALTGTFSIPSVTVTGITLTNNNTLTVGTALAGSGTLLQGSNAVLIITGTSSITGLNPTTNTPNTVTYNGGAQTIKAVPYYHLILSGSGTKTIAGLTTVNGDFILSGSVTAAPNLALTIAGDFTLGSGTTFSAGALIHNLKGNWINHGGTFTTSTSTIIFNGSIAQQIAGTAPTTFNNLTLNNSEGLTLATNNTTVNNTLNLTSGKLTTGAYTMVITNATNISGAGPSTYVNGSLQKSIAIAIPSVNFEIGDVNVYAPLVLDFSGTKTAGTLLANTAPADHSNIGSSLLDATKSVNRTWTFSNTGLTGSFTYSATFNFVAGDVDAVANFNAFVVGKYLSSTWAYRTPVTNAPTSTKVTEITGLNNFGDFQIAECTLPAQPTNFTGNLTPCEGSSQTYSVTNVSGLTYTWVLPSGWTGTSTTNSITVTVGANSGDIKVTPNNACGSGPFLLQAITVNPKPSVTNQAVTICSEETFTVTPVNGGGNTIPTGTTYTWTNPVSIPAGAVTGGSLQSTGQSSISQTLTNTTNASATLTYTVTPTSGSCTGNTFSVTVTVSPNPSVTNQTSTICSATAFTITPANGGGNIVPAGTTYTWTLPVSNPVGAVTGGSSQSTGQTSISQTLTNTTSTAATLTYTVTPKSGSCTGATFTITVTVNPKPAVTAQTTTICSAANFTVTPADGGGSLVPTGTTYTWTSPVSNPAGAVTGGSLQSTGQSSISQTLTNTTNTSATLTYTVTPTSGSCAGNTFSVTVTVSPKPTVINQTATICSEETFTVTPVNGGGNTIPTGTTYTWTNPVSNPAGAVTGGSLQSTGQSSISQTLTNTTNASATLTYTVTPTSGSCTGNTFSVTVTVSPKPSVTNQTSTICSATAFTITPANGGGNIVPAGTTYTWTLPVSNPVGAVTGGSSQSTGQTSISQTLTNTTSTAATLTYTVTPKSGSCTGATFIITVTVNPKPAVTAQTTTICSAATFTVTPADGGGSLVPTGTTYTWTSPVSNPAGAVTGGSLQSTGQSSISQTLTNTTNTSATLTYTVSPTSGSCAGSTFSVTVTISPKPTVINQTATICSEGTFTVTPVNGGGNIIPTGTTYTWTNPVSNPAGAVTGGSLQSTGQSSISQTLTNTTNTSATLTYTVTPTTGSCLGNTFTVTVTVSPKPTVNATPTSQTLCSGLPITQIDITNPNSVAGTSFTWTRTNGTATTGNLRGIAASGSGATITGTFSNTTNVQQTAVFTITATAGSCSSNTTVTVIVNPQPTINVSPTTQTICSGPITAINITNPNAVAGTSFSWSRNNIINITGFENGTSSAISGSLTNSTPTQQTTTFTINATSPEACFSTASSNVLIDPSAISNPGGPDAVCQSTNPAQITLTGSSVEVATLGAWSIALLNPSNGGNNGTLTNTTNQSNTNIPLTKYTPPANYTGIVTLRLTTNNPGGVCNAVSADRIINVRAKPTSITSGSTTICSGGNANISVAVSGTAPWSITFSDGNTLNGITASPYIYNVSPTSTTTYTVTSVIDANCTAESIDRTGSAVITVNQPIAITTQPASTSFCSNYPNSIKVKATGTGLTYQWFKNGNPVSNTSNINGATTDSLSFVLVTVGDAGDYYCMISGTAPCTPLASSTATITVNEEITITQQPTPVTICQGSPASFTVTATGSIASTNPYRWRKNGSYVANDAVVSGAQTATINFTNTDPAYAGSYDLEILSTGVCPIAYSQPASFIVYPTPLVNKSQLYLDEPFTNTLVGPLTGQNGWVANQIGATTTDVQVNNVNGLIYPDYGTGGCNYAEITGGSDPYKPFSSTIATTSNSSIWTAFLVDPSTIHSSACVEFSLALRSANGNYLSRFFMSSSGGLRFGISIGDHGNGQQAAASTSAFPLGPTYFIVIRYDVNASGNDVMYLWVNPPVNSEPSTSSADVSTTAGAGNDPETYGTSPINSLVLSQGGGQCLSPDAKFDDIKVANNWGDITFPSDAAYYNGSATAPINFTSNVPGATYSWTNDQTSIGLAASGTGSIASFTAANTTNSPVSATIRVRATANGCLGPENTFTITVKPSPYVVASPTSQAICSGQSITPLAISGTGTSYNWTRSNPGTALTGTVPSSGTITGASGSISGTLINTTSAPVLVTFTITPVISCNNGPAITATVLVNPIPTITLGLNPSVCAGTVTAFLPYSATTGNPVVYSVDWNAAANSAGFVDVNNVTLPATAIELTVPATVAGSTYTGTLTVSSAEGCISSNQTINVRVNSVTSGSIATSQTFCGNGNPAAFTQTAAATGTSLTYQWQSSTTNCLIDFNNISGATANVYDAPSLSTTTYFHRVVTSTLTATASLSGVACPVSSNCITVTINPMATANAGAPQNVCAGSSVSLTGSIGGGATSATWTAPSGSFSNPTSLTSNYTPSITSGSVVLTLTTNDPDGAGPCLPATSTVSVTISDVPAITSSPVDADICLGANATFTAAGSGTGITYQWQISTDAGSNYADLTNLSPYSGVTSPTLTVATPGVTMIDNLYRLRINTPPPCNLEATSSGVRIKFKNVWLGNVNSNWQNNANWSNGTTPTTACPDVHILNDRLNQPILNSGSSTITNLIIYPGVNEASLTIANQPATYLQVAGTITSNPQRIHALDGKLELNASGLQPAQQISGGIFVNRTLNYLVISSANGASLTTTAGDTLNISNHLKFGNVTGVTFDTKNNLTLLSRANGTASVGVVTGNSITGFVNVERYISAQKKWRFLSIPTLTTQSFRQSWQEGNTANSNALNPGYGTTIVNGTPSDYIGNGFDFYTITGPSVKTYNSATNDYTGISSTFNPIATARGYMTFIRGNRSATTFNDPPSSTIMRTTGLLKQGTMPAFSIPVNRFYDIGNPYASALDMRSISKTDLPDFFYIWDPSLTGGLGLGGIQTFSKSSGDYFATPGGGSYTGAGPFNFIESGLAFFVSGYGTTQPGSIYIKEADKAPDSRLVFRTQGMPEKLRANLHIGNASAATLVDGVLVDYADHWSNAVDINDAIKLLNFNENVAILRDNKLLVIERRKTISDTDTIFLHVTNVRVQNYQWSLELTNMDSTGRTGFLLDRYLNTRTPLDLNGKTHYNFNIQNNPGSYASDRFKLVFHQARPLKITSISASRNNDQSIQVDWSVENENGSNLYTTERSSDGNTFMGIITTASTAGTSAYASYRVTDLGASIEDSYYRIKATGANGHVIYSAVVKVAGIPATTKPSISVYPNPVVDKTIQVHFVNQPQGTYNIRLTNAAGQTIDNFKFELASGNVTKTIQLRKTIAAGYYRLRITAKGGNKSYYKIMIE